MLTICCYICYFMCLGVLLECLSVCVPCVCIVCGGTGASGTEVTNACELPYRCGKSNLGSLEKQLVLSVGPCLQPSFLKCLITYLFILCTGMCVYVGGVIHATVHEWRSKENMQE